MIQANTFAVHVTYTCPLTCDHCCFSSAPTVKDRLDVDTIRRTIAQLSPEKYKLIAFTGGEPFLIGARLTELVKFTHDLGFVTRIVTSAYWAASAQEAQRRLSPLKAAGLDELSISWDDYHERQTTAKVDFEHIRRAVQACLDLDLLVAINVVRDDASHWTAERVRGTLGLPDTERRLNVLETPLNLTGRAKERLADSPLLAGRYLGPCPYVVTGPTLSAKNKLMACCGVIPETQDLVYDTPFVPEAVNGMVEAMERSALLSWLYLRGPYHIMEEISARHGVAIPTRDEVGGNCDACNLLFTLPGIREHIPTLVAERVDEISDELALMDELGLLNSAHQEGAVMNFWANKSVYGEHPSDAPA